MITIGSELLPVNARPVPFDVEVPSTRALSFGVIDVATTVVPAT